MHSHSASERSVGYLFLMRARVANHYPTHPFRTVSLRCEYPEGWLWATPRSGLTRFYVRALN